MNVYEYEGTWFWILFYLWFALEMLFWVRARILQRGEPRKQNDDRGSAALIMLGMYVLIFVSIVFSVSQWGLLPRWTQYVGFVLMIVGMGIRFPAIIRLGRFFSPNCRGGFKPRDRSNRTVLLDSAPSIYWWMVCRGGNRLWSSYMVGSIAMWCRTIPDLCVQDSR